MIAIAVVDYVKIAIDALGKGNYTFANSSSSYNGEFKNGNFNGFGIYIFGSGDTYEGQFIENQMSGKGVLRYSDGSIFEGAFRDNKKM